MIATKQNQGGFTLIELMIVMTVSLIGMAGVLSIFTTNSRANKYAQESAEAVEIAEETLEELRSFSIDEIQTTLGYGPITQAGWGPVDYHNSPSVQGRGALYHRQLSAIELLNSPTLVRFNLTLRWADGGADPTDPTTPATLLHTIQMESVRTRQGML